MIIVLEGADFSQNNLGQIDIDYTLDDFTLAAIAASGNSSLTDDQQRALNFFFKRLGAFGGQGTIWGKLTHLWLPMIAGDLAHALVNYKDNTVSATPNSAQYTLQSKGVKAIVDNASAIGVTLAQAPNKTDISMFGMADGLAHFMRVGSSSSGRYGMELRNPSGNQANFRVQRDGASTSMEFIFDAHYYDAKIANLSGISIYGSETGNALAFTSEEVLSGNANVASGDINVNVDLMRDISNTSTTANGAVRLLAIGTHFSEQEMLQMKVACEALRDALV